MNLSKSSYGVIGVTSVFGCLFLAFLFWLFCAVTVEPGMGGVIYSRNGGVQDYILTQGMHTVSPIEHVIEYPLSTQTVFLSKTAHEGRKGIDDSISVSTKDSKPLNMDITFAYHMEPGSLPTIYSKFGGADHTSIQWGYMKNHLYGIVNNTVSHYGIADVTGDKREEISNKVFKNFSEIMAQDGITIEYMTISRAEPADDTTRDQLQAITNAQLQAKQMELQKQVTTTAAENQKILAEGNAAAQKINADAQAYANAKMQQSTTEQVIALEWIKKWNGVLPTTAAGNQGFMINLK